MSKRFVLLDRDGTINVEVEYVLDPSDLVLIPGAANAMRELRSLGLGIVVVTNQSPVGRGWLTSEQLDEIHDRLLHLLRAEGVEVEGVYACPHTPQDECGCRKPRTGMALRAAEEHGFSLAEAFVVGDHASDMQMGRAVGATTILVRSGHGREELERGADAWADHVVADLPAAAAVIREAVLAGAPR